MIDSGFKGLYDEQLASVNQVLVVLLDRITPEFSVICPADCFTGSLQLLKCTYCIVD